jgi:hypothetical protein
MAWLPNLASATTPDSGTMVVDVVVVRPLCLVSTIVGSVFFVVALPVAAISGSVRSTSDALIAAPARATFTRPIGEFDELED